MSILGDGSVAAQSKRFTPNLEGGDSILLIGAVAHFLIKFLNEPRSNVQAVN